MSDSPNVVKLVKVAADAEHRERETVNDFLEHCKEQQFESIMILGMRDGRIYATQYGIESKVEALGILQMAAYTFLHKQ